MTATVRQIDELEREVSRLRGDAGRTRNNGVTFENGRVRGLSDPIHERDAVNLRTLRRELEGVGGGGSNYIPEDDITSTGTTHTLSYMPAAVAQVSVWLNGKKLERVELVPDSDQFTVSGQTVTTGYSLTSSDLLVAAYPATAAGQLVPEEVLGTGTVHVLSNTPLGPSSVALFLNGQRLGRVTSSPDQLQFSVNGNTITTGYNVTSGDFLAAMYLY